MVLPRCRIGSGNVFREHVTVHRSNSMEEDTVIEWNYLWPMPMWAIIVESVTEYLCQRSLLGGHVVLEDEAFLSGHCSINSSGWSSGNDAGARGLEQGPATLHDVHRHQHDVWSQHGRVATCGPIPLRAPELKRLYHHLFSAKIPSMKPSFKAKNCLAPPTTCLDFIQGSTRGICKDVRQGIPCEEAKEVMAPRRRQRPWDLRRHYPIRRADTSP